LDDLRKLIGNFRLPAVDVAALIDWQRKDGKRAGRAESASL
jgi:hypothetical protein